MPQPATPPATEDPRKRLTDLFFAAVPKVAAALGVTGVVALFGGFVTWVRLGAAELPADEAVNAISTDDLVIPGALSIASFVLFGAIGLALVRALDPYGNFTTETTRALIVLVVAGTIAALWIDGADPADHRWAASGLLVLIAAAGFLWAVPFRLAEDIARNAGIRAEARRELRFTTWPDGARHLSPVLRLIIGLGCLALGLLVLGLLTYRGLQYLGLAAVAGLFCLAAARGSRASDFFWVGVAVFLAVGAFAAGVTAVRTLDNPKVKPVALLVKGDLNGLSGLYIGQSDDRVYVGRVSLYRPKATEKDDRPKLKPRDASGRMLSVKRDDVIAMSIGAPRGVPDAMLDGPCRIRELQLEQLTPEQRRAAVAPACGAQVDRSKPRLKVGLLPRRSARAALKRGIGFTVRSSEKGTLVAALRSGPLVAGQTRARAIVAGRQVRVVVRLNATGRLIARRVRPALELVVRVTDAAGNVRRSKRNIRLVRAR